MEYKKNKSKPKGHLTLLIKTWFVALESICFFFSENQEYMFIPLKSIR